MELAKFLVFEPTYRNPIDFCSRMFQNRTNMFSRSKFHQELDFEEQSTFHRQGKSQNERVPKSTDGTVQYGTSTVIIMVANLLIYTVRS